MKLNHLFHPKSSRRTTSPDDPAPGASQRHGTSSAGSPPLAPPGRPMRRPDTGSSIAPRSNRLPPGRTTESNSSMLGAMRSIMAWGASGRTPAPEPSPRAWLDTQAPEAKAARQRLLDGATLLPRQVHHTSPLAGAPYRLDTYFAPDGRTDSIVLVPAQELVPGMLRSDRFIELSPSRLKAVNALSTTHPGVQTRMPDTQPRLRTITPGTAAHIALAREAIDLVKALLPGGSGNQIKDIAATGGDSLLRSSLSYTLGGSPVSRASAAIQSQGGYCDAQASLVFQLLSQNAALEDARIDIVDGGPGGNHVFVVIRGETPEHDIVVDPWPPFASPSLVPDALPMHRSLLGVAGGGIRETKPSGTVAPALDIGEALRWQAIRGRSSLREQFIAAKSRDPDRSIESSIGSPEDRWDVPFSGNPNVRFEIRDASGRRLTEFPVRFDMQRTGASVS